MEPFKWLMMPIIIAILLIALGVALLTIGLITLLGIALVLVGLYLLLKKKKTKVAYPLILVGIVLVLVLAYMPGLEVYTVDFSIIPGFEELHTLLGV